MTLSFKGGHASNATLYGVAFLIKSIPDSPLSFHLFLFGSFTVIFKSVIIPLTSDFKFFF